MAQLLTVDRSDNYIELPGRLVLSAEGISIFKSAGRPLQRVTRFNNSVAEGLASAGFNAQTVQKLVMNGYVEEINITLPELLRSRSKIIDMTKLVTFGILYKKMNPALGKMLLESDVISLYNRKNPGNMIKSINDINKQKMQLLKQARAHAFEVMQFEIRDLVVQSLVQDETLEEEDRLLQIRSLEKFVTFIDDRIWYLYFIVYQSPLRQGMTRLFVELVTSYLHRTKIATYLATILMELIQNAEKANFDRVMLQNRLVKSPGETATLLRDPEKRKQVSALAFKTGQNLNLNWLFDSGKASTSREFRIEIQVTNPGSISHMIQSKLKNKLHAETGSVSLSDFYEDTGQQLGAGLGLLYISYLRDECQKAKIQFTSQVFADDSADTTTAKLQVVF